MQREYIYHKGFLVSTGDGRRRLCGEQLALWEMGEDEECQEMAERGTDGRGTRVEADNVGTV